jgi:hypothetical protein
LVGLLDTDPGKKIMKVAAGKLPLEGLGGRAVTVLKEKQALLEFLRVVPV